MARAARRDPNKEKYWRETIAKYATSGKSVRMFCAQFGINENLFHSWQRELKKRDAESNLSRPSEGKRSEERNRVLTPVRLVQSGPVAEPSIEIRLHAGHVITIPSTISSALLTDLIRVLKE